MGEDGNGYILGRTEAEYARLRAQARTWEEITGRVLAKAGLAPGMRCLDAGCGPGEAMRLMGHVVGANGRVTGLDVDAALGTHMLAELRRDGGARFEFVAADVTRGDPVPGAPFDFVFARLLLCHMTDPAGVVGRLAALARPGGRLVLMDYDMTRVAAQPPDPRIVRGREVIVGCFERSGRHADAGLRLAGYLDAAGLPPPEGTDVGAFYVPLRAGGVMMRTVLASLAATAAGLGIATEDEVAELQRDIEALEAAHRHYLLGPLMIGAWTTLP
jgi:SAM-dependent methyltransferase